MILSEERQTHFAHVLIDGLYHDDLVDYSDDDEALRAAKRAIMKFVAEEEQLDARVRQKLVSLKRGVVEGSPEWDTLYRKYYEEELNKRG